MANSLTLKYGVFYVEVRRDLRSGAVNLPLKYGEAYFEERSPALFRQQLSTASARLDGGRFTLKYGRAVALTLACFTLRYGRCGHPSQQVAPGKLRMASYVAVRWWVQ